MFADVSETRKKHLPTLAGFAAAVGRPLSGQMYLVEAILGRACYPGEKIDLQTQRALMRDPVFALMATRTRCAQWCAEVDAEHALAGALVPLAKSTPPRPNRHTRGEETIKRWVLEAPPILVVRAKPKKKKKTKAERRAEKTVFLRAKKRSTAAQGVQIGN